MFNQQPVRRLFRSRTDRQIAGVSGGIATYLNVDPTVVRILWVVGAFVTFPVAPLAYLTLALVIPQEPAASDTYMI